MAQAEITQASFLINDFPKSPIAAQISQKEHLILGARDKHRGIVSGKIYSAY
jgi:hypothetical protein